MDDLEGIYINKREPSGWKKKTLPITHEPHQKIKNMEVHQRSEIHACSIVAVTTHVSITAEKKRKEKRKRGKKKIRKKVYRKKDIEVHGRLKINAGLNVAVTTPVCFKPHTCLRLIPRRTKVAAAGTSKPVPRPGVWRRAASGEGQVNRTQVRNDT